jgi:hypothetical protein
VSLLLTNVGRSAINIPAVTASESGSVTPVEAFINFATNGVATYSGGQFVWFSAIALNVGDDYEIKAEINEAPEGAFDGAVDTWLAMTSAREWSLSSNSGINVGSLLISIRKAGETTVMRSGIISFNVAVT